MKVLLTTTLALGAVIMLGATQPAEALQPAGPSQGQSDIVLVHGHGGHGGHWGGHGGWHHHGHGWGDGYWGGPYWGGPGYYYDVGPGPGLVCVGGVCLF